MTSVNEQLEQDYKDKSKEYICDANSHIEYEPKYKYKTRTTKITCFDKYNKDNLLNYDISLLKTYEPNVNGIRSLRYAKKDLKKDIIKRIKSYNNIDIKDQVKNITFNNATIDMSKLPPLKDTGKKHINTFKYQYSENYDSVTNYFKSILFGDIGTEKSQKYKPFYQKMYDEHSNVEDKLDKEYKKIKPRVFNGKNIITLKRNNIEVNKGLSVYYKDNEDGTFNIATLVRSNYIQDEFGFLQLVKTTYNATEIGMCIAENMFNDSYKVDVIKDKK